MLCDKRKALESSYSKDGTSEKLMMEEKQLSKIYYDDQQWFWLQDGVIS